MSCRKMKNTVSNNRNWKRILPTRKQIYETQGNVSSYAIQAKQTFK
jgi:hypothetical protein